MKVSPGHAILFLLINCLVAVQATPVHDNLKKCHSDNLEIQKESKGKEPMRSISMPSMLTSAGLGSPQGYTPALKHDLQRQKSWLDKFNCYSTEAKDILEQEEERYFDYENWNMRISASEAKELAARFKVNTKDKGISESKEKWEEIKANVSSRILVENMLPYLHEGIDPGFAYTLLLIGGNYKSNLALLSDDKEDRRNAVKFMILKYEADRNRKGYKKSS